MCRLVIATCAAAVLLAGCKDEGGAPADARPDTRKRFLDGIVIVPELAPDWTTPVDQAPVCEPALIGKFCKVLADCNKDAPGMTCLKTTKVDTNTYVGVCTCGCRPDDSKTTEVNEDSCPGAATNQNRCITITQSDNTKVSYCLHHCRPKIGSSDCQAGVACDSWTTVTFRVSQPLCAVPGCSKDADCPVSTSTTCSMSNPSCPTGETCLRFATGSDEGRCHRAGKCDLASGLCDAHALGKTDAKVADPCQSDLDCAGNMECLPEVDENKYKKKVGAPCTTDSECCSNDCDKNGLCTKAICAVERRHGYCTIVGCEFGDTLTVRACPQDSACNLRYYTGYCQKTCDMTKPETCRGVQNELYGDYECRNWHNLPAFLKTDVPVCDFGTLPRCSFFSAASGYDCSILGADPGGKINPTHMKCRTLDGKDAAGGLYDPSGFCLDDTGSGTAYRDPLPTP